MSEGPNIEKQPSKTQLRTLWAIILLLLAGLVFTTIMVINLGNETANLNRQLSEQNQSSILPPQST